MNAKKGTQVYTRVDYCCLIWTKSPQYQISQKCNSNFELLHVDGCVGMAKLYASLYLSVANIPQRQCTFKWLKTVRLSWFCIFTWPNGFSGWFNICDCTWKLELELIFRLFTHSELSHQQRTILKRYFMDWLTLIISMFIFHTEILRTGDNYNYQRHLFQKRYNCFNLQLKKEIWSSYLFTYQTNNGI